MIMQDDRAVITYRKRVLVARDRRAGVVGRARHVVDFAVHVFHDAAFPTHHVVVVVADPRFVSSRGSSGFDPPHQTSLGQRV